MGALSALNAITSLLLRVIPSRFTSFFLFFLSSLSVCFPALCRQNQAAVVGVRARHDRLRALESEFASKQVSLYFSERLFWGKIGISCCM
jgi:hypothetical protein